MKLLLAAFLILVAGCSQSAGQTTAPTSSTSTPPSTGSAGPSAAATVSVGVKDFALDPAAVTVHGSTVSLAVKNSGPTVHNVTIRDASGAILMATRDLKEGETETISGPVPAGTYVLFCSLPGHESLGVRGTLVVAP